MNFHAFYLRTRFWIKDWMNGSPIGTPYREIKWFNEHSKEAAAAHKKAKLKKLLDYACAHTSFYKKYEGCELKDFPVMTKKDIIAHHAEIEVPHDVIPRQQGDVYIQRTSGSTGMPLEIPQDTLKRRRRIAELKYFGKQVGFRTHELLIHLRIWNKWQSKSLKQIRRENIIPFDISDMGAGRMKELVEQIQREKVFALRGYASMIDQLANYVIAHPVSMPSLKIIISVSETLEDDTRAKVKKHLGCEIISQYANEECGIIAQELPPTKPHDNVMYLNHAGYVFEILKMDADEPEEYGKLGRIVMTDLHNYAFPLIRYDTGDVGMFLPPDEHSGGHPVLGKLFGRKLDICYTTKGTPFNSMLLNRTLKHFDNIQQWQFIQKEEKAYCIKVILKEKCDADSYLAPAVTELKKVIGDDADIKIELVDTIPVLASRKRKSVINEWNFFDKP